MGDTVTNKYRSLCPQRRRGWRPRNWQVCSRGSGRKPVVRCGQQRRSRNGTGESGAITHSAVAPALGHDLGARGGGRGGHDGEGEGSRERSDPAGEGGGVADERWAEGAGKRTGFYSRSHGGRWKSWRGLRKEELEEGGRSIWWSARSASEGCRVDLATRRRRETHPLRFGNRPHAHHSLRLSLFAVHHPDARTVPASPSHDLRSAITDQCGRAFRT